MIRFLIASMVLLAAVAGFGLWLAEDPDHFTLVKDRVIEVQEFFSPAPKPKRANPAGLAKPALTHRHSHPNAASDAGTSTGNVLIDAENKGKKGLEDGPLYTCPMDPQIRQNEPGKCPICGMDLVISAKKGETPPNVVAITPAARRFAGIETVMVEPVVMRKEIAAVGFLELNESGIATISARAKGRVESLAADFTGVKVKKGQKLGVFYSPELYDAQVEYIEAIKASKYRATDFQKELLAAARSNLLELGMSRGQIARLRKSGRPAARTVLYSPASGTVISKKAFPGKYVAKGEVIFEISNLGTIWLMLDIFPEDAPYIRYGQKVTATLRSQPGKTYTGRVAFVDPIVKAQTRTIRVRVEMDNSQHRLRPGDYAEALLSVPVTISGGAIYDKELAGKWISPTHPHIIRTGPGVDPKSGAKLVPTSQFGYLKAPDDTVELLAVPRDAVLRIGSKSVIFVEEATDQFTIRYVTVGDTIGDQIIIVKGLEEFEEVATKGVFLLDSQMQLENKTSLSTITDPDAAKAAKTKAEGKGSSHE